MLVTNGPGKHIRYTSHLSLQIRRKERKMSEKPLNLDIRKIHQKN